MRSFGDKIKRFARTRFFIASASVAVFLTVVPAVLALMGRGDIIRSAVNLVATPFKSAAVFCGEAVDGFFDYFYEFDRLKAENEQLRDELNEAQSKNEAADAALAENEWLRNFILFSEEHPEYKLIDAKTVGRDSGDYITSFTLNKGTAAGIEVGQCVITPEGLVGYVHEAGLNYSKVKTVISGGVSVGAVCERSGAYGMIEGVFGYTEGELCKLTLSSRNADVKVGDAVVTSGVGSVYPYGFKLGTVSSVEIDEYSRELVVYVKPSVDFSELTRVMVVGREAE